MSKPELKLDWCSHAAAKFAVENWHYSKSMPNASVRVGVWENGQFIGAVLYGVGAGNSTNGKRYGLGKSHDIAELVRVALRNPYHKTSQIVARTIRMVKQQSPNLQMLISFADEYDQGHVGTIYQAMNWVYTGVFNGDGGFIIHGKRLHPKTVHGRGWVQSVEWLKHHVDPECRSFATLKHRYLYPLDAEMRERIKPLAKPYPKRVTSIDSDAAAFQVAEGGANPTVTLQN